MRKFYVTTAIPYVNASPHIGFAMEILQADVLARFWRNKQKSDTFFLTGVDEHGSKIVKLARSQGISVHKLIDKNASKFVDLTKELNISNDNFVRTSDKKRHWKTAQYIWEQLSKNKDIYKDKYRGLYCVGCEAFINKKDLVDGKCPEHNTEPEKLSEENYFFRLSKYLPKIKHYIKTDKLQIVPKEQKQNILSLIDGNMGNVSFSRPKSSLSWGIPVPGDKNHVMYVWCDALSNYLSGIGYPDKRFKRYWPADVHVIGKDILRFHAAVWPGMLLSLGLELPKVILVHGYITSNGRKMSKSLGNVVDPFELIKKYGADALRYYLLRYIPTTKDGDFSYKKFEQCYNADLVNDLGNLVRRTQGIGIRIDKNMGISTKDITFQNKVDNAVREFRFDVALQIIWHKISLLNKFIDKKQLWVNKNEKDLSTLLNSIQQIALALGPFMPETSAKILNWYNKPLFPRI